MTDTLADALPREIERVQKIKERYVEAQKLAGRHAAGFDISIQIMEFEINSAVRACAEGDTVAMIDSLLSLRDYSDD